MEVVLWPNSYLMTSFSQRFWGLVKQPEPSFSQAFWFPKCQSIHTFGMAAPIDVLAVNNDQQLVAVKRHVCPRNIIRFSDCAGIIELAAFSPWPLEQWIGQSLVFSRQGEPDDVNSKPLSQSVFSIACVIAAHTQS